MASGEERLLESTVEPLDEAVGLRVIRGGCVRPNAPCLHELGPCVGEKLHPSVGRDRGWDSVVRDPSERETIHDRFDGHVPQRDRGWPTCESVDNCEDIFVSVGLTECDDVEIDVVETLRGTAKSPIGGMVCLITLALWQWMHSRAHLDTSCLSVGQTNFSATVCRVLSTPGCPRP